MTKPQIRQTHLLFATLIVLVALLAIGASKANATLTTYTSGATFFAALGATPYATEIYDEFTINQVIPNGTTLNGITYTGFPGDGGRIDNLYNHFGLAGLAVQAPLNDPPHNFFYPGESFSVTFPHQVNAVAIYFNANPANLGDLYISTPVGTAFTGGTYDTGTFYFAGLISDTFFTTATIGAIPTSLSGFNVDNLTYAPVPLPPTLLLLGSGLVGLVGWRRLRKS